MAGNDRKRQQKLERKSAKRKEKKKVVARQEAGGLPARLSSLAKYPVFDSWIADATQGIGHGALAREGPNGMVAVACFLVDRYCLGVKSVVLEVLHRTEYEEKYTRGIRARFPHHEAPPQDVVKLVTDAVAYARALGLSPAPEYQSATILFSGIDPTTSTKTFEFGKNGKPLFVAGPYDSPARCRQILALLEHHCGPGGFDYVIPLNDPTTLTDGGDFRRLTSMDAE